MAQLSRRLTVFLRLVVLWLLLLIDQVKSFVASGPRIAIAGTSTKLLFSTTGTGSDNTKHAFQRLSAFRFDDTHSCSADPSNNRHSASDWWYNVRSLPKSKVLRDVRNPVVAVGVWSFIVSLVHRFCTTSARPVWQSLAEHMSIPGTAHSFLVSALGLLLVFRTNSAYQRFYEGRKIWENILSVSRNMSRMVHLYKAEVGPDRYRRVLDMISAYPYLLRAHIRPGCLCAENDYSIPKRYRLHLTEHRLTSETRHEGQEDELRRNHLHNNNVPPPVTTTDCVVDQRHLPWRLFLPHSLRLIAHAENRPVWVCDRIAALINSVPYGPNFTSRERLSLLGMVDKLTNAVGECERIHQTAVPLNYARHSLRSLTIWLFTLPFALIKDLGLFTAPTVAVVAWLFFGVYQIGYSIEDPFQGSLRLSILCDTIRKNVVRTTAFDDLQPNLQLLQVQQQQQQQQHLDKNIVRSSASSSASSRHLNLQQQRLDTTGGLLLEDVPPTLRVVEQTLADAISVPVLHPSILSIIAPTTTSSIALQELGI